MKLFRRWLIIAIIMTFAVTGFCFQSSAEIYVNSMTKGWNLVSLRGDVIDNHYLSVFPTAMEGTLWGYENGQYVRKEIVELGKAYWLRFPEDDTILNEGINLTFRLIFTF